MASYREVFRRLRVEKNGAVSDAMANRGLAYGMNYGVSLPTIKDVAAEFGVDHDLAADLWRQEVRELRLAAIYVEDPAAVGDEQLERWGAELGSAEVAQVFGRELLWRTPVALGVVRNWLTTGDEFQRIAASHATARLAAHLTPDALAELPLNRVISNPLREVFKQQKALREKILSFAKDIDDLEWQLEEILLDEK